MPQNYEEVLKNIKEMRKSHAAPVDSMGCQKCSDGKKEFVVKSFDFETNFNVKQTIIIRRR